MSSTVPGMRHVERAPTLSRQAYAAMQSAIRDGLLRPGVMYSENELAATLGMSRTPVREAVLRLSREGLIEISSQRGFQLRRLSEAERVEIFDLRSVIESFVAGRLAVERTDGQIAHLEDLVRQQEQLSDPEQTAEFLALDEQFHLAQAEFLGLERTHATIENLRGAMWLIGFDALKLPKRHAEVITEHRAIVDALARGSRDDACAAAQAHIASTRAAAAGDASSLDEDRHATRVALRIPADRGN
jgi:DNA-binding GntR family transcriptional regulator